MDMNENIIKLSSLFSDKDWFHSVGTDEFNRPVVYVKKLNSEVMNVIPDRINDSQVIIQFSAAKLVLRSNYVNELRSLNTFHYNYDESTNFDVASCKKDLLNLEKICGIDNLTFIFYETHDDINDEAVTNISIKYPEVRKKMQLLYDDFGFDVLYEYLSL